MQVWGVTPSELFKVVHDVSYAEYDGNLVCDGYPEHAGVTDRSAVNFKLRVKDSAGPGHRVGFSRTSRGNRRRLVSACWHAHRDVMTVLFERFPNARLKSSLADYRGLNDFLTNFEYTGSRNAGSMMDPIAVADLCECELVHTGA